MTTIHYNYLHAWPHKNQYQSSVITQMSPVQFQIMSDLHLETPSARPSYQHFKIQPECKYLALLGDIGKVLDYELNAFLEDQLRVFEIVFFVQGNHEA
ncbi:hypothetical protein EAF00_002578 [Botryotinia globosa]|nr:hypothetical protein EAF00_002578 [Botryotinia globosa]